MHPGGAPYDDFPEAQGWDRVISTNVKALFYSASPALLQVGNHKQPWLASPTRIMKSIFKIFSLSDGRSDAASRQGCHKHDAWPSDQHLVGCRTRPQGGGDKPRSRQRGAMVVQRLEGGGKPSDVNPRGVSWSENDNGQRNLARRLPVKDDSVRPLYSGVYRGRPDTRPQKIWHVERWGQKACERPPDGYVFAWLRFQARDV